MPVHLQLLRFAAACRCYSRCLVVATSACCGSNCVLPETSAAMLLMLLAAMLLASKFAERLVLTRRPRSRPSPAAAGRGSPAPSSCPPAACRTITQQSNSSQTQQACHIHSDSLTNNYTQQGGARGLIASMPWLGLHTCTPRAATAAAPPSSARGAELHCACSVLMLSTALEAGALFIAELA